MKNISIKAAWASSIILANGFGQTVIAQTWEGQGEAGFVKTTGNTESDSLNLALDLGYTQGKWTNKFIATAYQQSSDEIDSADSLSADYILERELTPRSKLFASLGYLDDDFDGFTEKLTASLGYGYKLIDSERTTWETSAGIGYRDTSTIEIADDETITFTEIDGPTFVALSQFETALTPNTTFTDSFKSEFASDNSFFENEAAISVSMNDRFALKVAYLVRHNTDPGEGSEETDTITSFSLVYKLK